METATSKVPRAQANNLLATPLVMLYSFSYLSGNRWNHIENLDEFFERVSGHL